MIPYALPFTVPFTVAVPVPGFSTVPGSTTVQPKHSSFIDIDDKKKTCSLVRLSLF